MDFEAIILILIRALTDAGKQGVEKLLTQIDELICQSGSQIDNEIWFNIVLPAIKAHQPTCPPPVGKK